MSQRRKSLWRWLFKFHRYTGLSSALIIIMSAITGIVLNHSDELSLDKRFVVSSKLLDWYGIKASSANQGFAIQQQWLSQLNTHVYLDDKFLLDSPQPLVGIIYTADYRVIAFSNRLVLVSQQAEIIEEISFDNLQALGKNNDGGIFIKTAAGLQISTDDLLTWQASQATKIHWSTALTLPTTLQQHLQQQSRQNTLPYERVLLDIHSGRFFGQYGIYVIDFMAILFILLVISGLWIWLRHTLKTHRKKN